MGDPHSEIEKKEPSPAAVSILINGVCFEARPENVFLLFPDSSNPDTLSPRRE